jgi:hypothetical protein
VVVWIKVVLPISSEHGKPDGCNKVTGGGNPARAGRRVERSTLDSRHCSFNNFGKPADGRSVNRLRFAKYKIENHPARLIGDGRDSSADQSARPTVGLEAASPPSARCEAIATSCAQPRTADASPGPRAVPSSATVTQRKGAGAGALTRDRPSQHRTRPDELLACGKAADCSAAP